VPAAMFVCQADPETVRTRLEKRPFGPSDADWAVYLASAQNWQEPSLFTRRFLYEISMVDYANEYVSKTKSILQEMELVDLGAFE
jgi:predicted kinase